MNGEFKVRTLTEGDDKSDFRRIAFREELHVEWWVLEKTNPEKDDDGLTVLIILNDGIQWKRHFSTNAPFEPNRIAGTNQEDIKEAILKKLVFEFAHAYFHPQEDPNYCIRHWAIHGTFRHEVDLIESCEGKVEPLPGRQTGNPEWVNGTEKFPAYGESIQTLRHFPEQEGWVAETYIHSEKTGTPAYWRTCTWNRELLTPLPSEVTGIVKFKN